MEGPTMEEPVVLIVDDDEWILEILERLLKGIPAKVIKANSAMNGFHEFVGGIRYIDLVITDVAMPGTTDGFGLVTLIQSLEGRRPKFIVMSSDGSQNARTAEARGLRFLAKPFELDDATALIREVLGE